MKKFRILLLAGIAATMAFTPAMAERKPAGGRYDPRIRTVVYKADDVVGITATYGISTMIVFGDNEMVETITLGDSVAWQVVPNSKKNIIFIKPVEKNARSNMNVVTNRRIYSFDLSSNSSTSRSEQTFKIRFLYPEEQYNAKLLAEAKAAVESPNLSNLDVANTNTDYAYKGDDGAKPAAVFDDGVKTFFKFTGDVPAIYAVDGDRRETLVNFRREKEFIVVDRVNFQWTMRNGNVVTCVFNLRAPSDNPKPSVDAVAAPRKIQSGLGGRALAKSGPVNPDR
ncbi:P-type conjugative transfer protein VirB9 [Brucella endophytica]|uniref:P-type conjugative transfer protein VirB9 n=1 Tax=Brucella endophytica TaxID=1963359 RepID=A0A916SND2_9HYPH|nr:P-type conjugative transfer protein VirB9 [Brucella endophytica]GGB09408.1 P-type conjugative transfer protein VirB9 [Brucella endophytica]